MSRPAASGASTAGARAPSFELPSTTGGSVGLDDLVAGGPAVLIFAAEECPTCALALRRLAPIVGPLRDAGVGLAVVFEDPLDVAARVAREARFTGTVLAEPAPYDTSRAYGLESLPTTVLLDRDASVAGTVVGWDAAALSALVGQACDAVGAPAPGITDEAPRTKPGCAAKSTYDEEMLALVESAGAADEMDDMFERGWTDGLPVVPPTRSRVDAMLGGRDPQQSLGEVPPGMGEATLERIADCESGGDPTAISPTGQYRGKYQFDRETWQRMGGSGDPAAAPEAEQDARAAKLLAEAGTSPWPVCG